MLFYLHPYCCSKCNLKCADYTEGNQFEIAVYELRGGALAPLLDRTVWCSTCAAIVDGEKIPSLLEIDLQIKRMSKSLRSAADEEDVSYRASVRKLESVFVASADAWKAFAIKRAAGPRRCLRCSGTSLLDLIEVPSPETTTFIHPGCGGKLIRPPGSCHMMLRTPPEVRIVRYTPEGIKVAERETSEPQPKASASVPKRMTNVETSLHRSAFNVLGATVRDDRRKIVELAEEASLRIDAELAHKARSELTNPRARLSAEASWLPGVSPRKATDLLATLSSDPLSVRKASGLPTLARANLLSAAFETVDGSMSPDTVAEFIGELAACVEEFDAHEVLRDVNEDRAVSGFPEVRTVDLVEEEFSERKRAYRGVIKGAIDRMPTGAMIDAVTRAVRTATLDGETHAPELIDELVDNYAVATQGFLDQQAVNVQTLINAIRDNDSDGEVGLRSRTDKLEAAVRIWDKVAQPIQLSAKARGIKQEQSLALGYAIRGLAIDLWNEQDQLDTSRRLTDLLGELFAEVPEFLEQVQTDAKVLGDIANRMVSDTEQSEREREQREREITFSAEVGRIFKDKLRISSDGISWKSTRVSLDSVTGVRWGSVRNSVNGIPTGTDFTIGIATRQDSFEIDPGREAVFTGFVEALWRAVCVRLMIEMLQALKSGATLNFGEITIDDSGPTLTRRRLLSANERIPLDWDSVTVSSINGSFLITSKTDSKIFASASFKDDWNTHLLDHIVRGGFKKGIKRLSDFFDS